MSSTRSLARPSCRQHVRSHVRSHVRHVVNTFAGTSVPHSYPPLSNLSKTIINETLKKAKQDPSTVTDSPGVQQADSFVDRIFQLDEDTQQLVFEKIHLLDAEAKYNKETDQLRLQVEREREEQAFLLAFIDQDLQREEKDRQRVFQLEFDVTDEIATSGNPILYVKRILESKNTEVSYRQLAPEHIPLFDEAKAKEVSEVLGSLAYRAIQSKEEFEDAMKHPEKIFQWDGF